MTIDLEEITREHAALWSSHDAAGVARLYDPDCRYEDVPRGRVVQGWEGVIDFANGMFAAVPDITVKLRSVSASGSHSAREYDIEGTYAQTGASISLPGVSIAEFRDGLIVRNSDYYDLASLLRQIGSAGPRPAHT